MENITSGQFESARVAYTVFTIRGAARLARQLGYGYDAVPDGAPDTFAAICAEHDECWKTHRAFRVWSGASDNTVFAIPEGNWAFRYWHDVCSHAIGRLSLETGDEMVAGAEWVKHVAQHFGPDSIEAMIAYADTCRQTLYEASHGYFPADQLAFVKECLRVDCGSAPDIIASVHTITTPDYVQGE